MAWMDSRCSNATDSLDENYKPKNCTKLCAKSPAATDSCCDNIWLPTINLMNAIQAVRLKLVFAFALTDCNRA